MTPTERVRITHPDFDSAPGTMTRHQFETIYKPLGWTEASDAVPGGGSGAERFAAKVAAVQVTKEANRAELGKLKVADLVTEAESIGVLPEGSQGKSPVDGHKLTKDELVDLIEPPVAVPVADEPAGDPADGEVIFGLDTSGGTATDENAGTAGGEG